jgi:CubicO group peptidase (beta-lactamase class C family)
MERNLLPRIPYSAPSLIMLLALSGCALSHENVRSETQQPSDATIRSILARRVDAKQSVGIVVGIANRDTSRFISYGTFNGPGTPHVTEDTVFEIGSVTKDIHGHRAG